MLTPTPTSPTPLSVSNLKTVQINSSKEQGAIVSFSAQVFPDGDINKVLSHTKQLEKDQAGSDVLVYDSTFARHWDSWSPTAGQKTQLFFVRLTRNPESFVTSSDDDYDAVSRAELPGPNAHAKWSVLTEAGPAGVAAEATRRVAIQAPLAGTPLECPVGPFGDASDFTLSSTHLAFHAKDPLVNPAWHTRTNVYLVPLSPKSKADAEPRAVTIGTQGATASPVFSPDGARLAWLEMREDGYEADRNRVMVYEVKTGLRWGVTESFDRSPGHLEWSPDGKKLFFTAEDDARVKLFEVAVPVPKDDATVAEAEAAAKAEPVTLTHHHSVTGFSPLSPTSVLLTTNSLTRPNELSLVSFAKSKGDDYAAPSDVTHSLLSTLTSGLGDKKELDEGESFYFKGAEGVQIQGWILFPPGLRDPATRKGKKLPLAFLVHGGPEGAWTDSWSTRWAPNIYASAGYITVAINPTGSTGFGEALTRGIRGQWGGRPFQDLVAGLDYVKETYPEIDGDRMAMLGASYGGYMANWIQGHNNATKFKAIVCHDGVFNTASTWFTGDELFFPEAEALATGSATPWEDKEAYDKWSPHNHIANFGTPELIIHSSRDYRLVEGEGLAMFNTLQRLGVPSRFVVFPSENHWVLSPHNSVKWHEQVLGWIGEWTAEGK